MGGHFDAVGFGDPSLGFEATREHLRAAIERGRKVAEAEEYAYYELETSEGCGVSAAVDQAGFLLNGCPYFRGSEQQRVAVESYAPWDLTDPHQGGARGFLLAADSSRDTAIAFALPRFAAEARRGPTELSVNLVGLGYRAVSHGGERRLPNDGRPASYVVPVGIEHSLGGSRRCNLDCRGRIEQARFLANELTGLRLAYALLDCDEARLEVVVDLPSLSGGLAVGAYLEGSFWLVGRPADGPPGNSG
jgi:hypothetical protein